MVGREFRILKSRLGASKILLEPICPLLLDSTVLDEHEYGSIFYSLLPFCSHVEMSPTLQFSMKHFPLPVAISHETGLIFICFEFKALL
jgi:hypothetical protein